VDPAGRRATQEPGIRRGLAPVLYATLALLVAGPLLAPGLVLAVDLAQTPRSPLATSYWGLPQGTHEGTLARLPIDALFAALGHAGLVPLGQKLLLVAIVLMSGWGMHRLVEERHGRGIAPVFAGVLYALNPFVYDRLYSGQWFIALGYALLPVTYLWLLRLLAGEHTSALPAFGVLAWLTGVASIHMAGLLAVLVVFTAVADFRRLRADPAARRRLIAGVAVAVLPSLYWLLPTPGLRDLWNHVGTGQLRLYSTLADQHWGLVATVLGLSGFWNNPAPIRDFLAPWPLFALALVVLSVRGLWLVRADPASRAVAAAGAFGFVMALGYASSATRPAFAFVLEHVPPARAFRESQKGVALVAFAYAFTGAPAAAELVRSGQRGMPRERLTGALVIVVVLLFGYRMLWGLWDGLHTSHFPVSWVQADATLRAETPRSRTLFLPWHGYFTLGFAHGRVVANMAPQYFTSPILASRSVGGGARTADTSDPVDGAVARLLAEGTKRRDFAACLARVGVTRILLAKEADWRRYRFLDHRPDVVVERRWPDMVLYRTRLPAGVVMARPAGRSGCAGPLRPLRFSRRSPVHYTADEPPGDERLVLGLPQPGDWSLTGRELRYRRWPAYRRNYLAGLIGIAVVAAGAVLLRRRTARDGGR
jgi:hypothetical protein